MAYTTINDPSAHYQTHAYVGDSESGGQTITFAGNSNLQPDLTWLKVRNSASGNHYLVNSSMGENNSVHIRLVPNGTQVEADGYTDNFASNGFRTTTDGVTVNANYNYISWNWKANGGTTSSNTEGSITTTVQANTTAGFSIVTWTGANSTATLGHGLGGVPEMIMSKCRDNAQEWGVYHKELGNDDYLHLNENAAEQDNAAYWNDTDPTSTVLSVGNSGPTNRNTSPMIAFLFRSIQGYSKVGFYKGNNAGDGPYLHLGFAPSFFMFKRFDGGTEDWGIVSSQHSPRDTDAATESNDMAYEIEANTPNAEANQIDFYFLSNGIKIDGSGGYANGDGYNYIYVAFAKNPFVTSTGTPVTAWGL